MIISIVSFSLFLNNQLKVAILKLVSPAANKGLAKMNEAASAPADGSALTTYGYGRTSEGGSASDVLKTLVTSVLASISTDKVIATKANPSSESTCQGDSGGMGLMFIYLVRCFYFSRFLTCRLNQNNIYVAVFISYAAIHSFIHPSINLCNITNRPPRPERKSRYHYGCAFLWSRRLRCWR